MAVVALVWVCIFLGVVYIGFLDLSWFCYGDWWIAVCVFVV